jgi:hypothetical protein
MNVFVLCTGRCGSTTFAKACRHARNYTAAHESRSGLIGDDRFHYPPNHIEVDNRLTWLLGRLDRHYGDNAVYVHLKRNDAETAQSFMKRYGYGIIGAYRSGILMGNPPTTPPMSVCLDYCDTINANIEAFLKGKSRQVTVSLETVKDDFPRFWDLIRAEGDLSLALGEWDNVYNATTPFQKSVLNARGEYSLLSRLTSAVNRQIRKIGFARVNRQPKSRAA